MVKQNPVAMRIMQMINDLTPDIKDKPFDPGWFSLRQEIERLAEEAANLRSALEFVAGGIHRDKSRNACWIAGEALMVQMVEQALRESPSSFAGIT